MEIGSNLVEKRGGVCGSLNVIKSTWRCVCGEGVYTRTNHIRSAATTGFTVMTRVGSDLGSLLS